MQRFPGGTRGPLDRRRWSASGRARTRLVALVGAAMLGTLAIWLWTERVHASSGAEPAYVVQGAKLVPDDLAGLSHFGRGVALSADGNTAVVGAPHDDAEVGSAWIFVRSGGGWSQQAKLSVPTSEESNFFGRGVAISGDGSTAVVGDPGNATRVGAAWVFVRSSTTWSLQAKLTGTGEVGPGQFGRSVALSDDGALALVGGYADGQRAGAAWTFTRTGAKWSQLGSKLTATAAGEEGPGLFGRGVALSSDGTTALIGASNDAHGTGAAWAYSRGASGWEQQGPKLTGAGESGGGQFGEAVALSGDGSRALVGGPNDAGEAGAAWAFARTGGIWAPDGEKLLGGEQVAPSAFGYSVALSADGATALVGGFTDGSRRGAAWAFSHETGLWEQDGPKLTPPEEPSPDRFGVSVSLSSDGSTALVGAYTDEGERGAAWPFVRTAGAEPPEVPAGPTSSTAASTVAPTGAGAPVARLGVLASTEVSAPVLAKTGNVQPVSGKVLVHLPHVKGFVLLPGLTQIPFGSIVDARDGTALVTVARGGSGGGTQSGEFFDGEFTLTQSHSGRVLAILTGGSLVSCKPRHAKRAQASAKRRTRKLWANAHGTFSTKGNYAVGAVQGTEWLTEDTCQGTLIKVTRDKVRVTDLVHHRSFSVRAGHSALVRARKG
ncbi:MAG TPA: FG-GAP repeat protein [Solirubrobacteraceae bacterium]|nr:FG-GAP repeat protein [Solirubrobacteraceae bacterium]